MKKEVIEDNETLKKEIKDLKKQIEEEKNAYNRMYNMYVEKENIIKHVENICESSIASIDNYLLEEKETKIVNGICTNRNGYQIERLKAYRTKSKEILGRIKELKGEDKE